MFHHRLYCELRITHLVTCAHAAGGGAGLSRTLPPRSLCCLSAVPPLLATHSATHRAEREEEGRGTRKSLSEQRERGRRVSKRESSAAQRRAEQRRITPANLLPGHRHHEFPAHESRVPKLREVGRVSVVLRGGRGRDRNLGEQWARSHSSSAHHSGGRS